jgi:hypothetical protein
VPWSTAERPGRRARRRAGRRTTDRTGVRFVTPNLSQTPARMATSTLDIEHLFGLESGN